MSDIRLATALGNVSERCSCRASVSPSHRNGCTDDQCRVVVPLTDLAGHGAVWFGSLKGCDSLLALCPGQSIKVGKMVPK